VKLGVHGAIEWPGNLDLCPDALYLRLTGKRPEDVFPATTVFLSTGGGFRGSGST
jgi:hypothetical protein